MRLDRFDLAFTVGLLLITGGLTLWSMPLALVVFGLVLCAIGLRGALAQQNPAPTPPALSPSTVPDHGTADDTAAA